VRLPLASALLLACAARAAGPEDVATFSPTLPSGVGDVSGWQLVIGAFETRGARGEYRFYVNPARAAMYQLMRYRVQLLDATTDGERRRGSAERVAFVRQPGTRQPMLFWELEPPGVTPAWRAIGASTDEYRREIGVLMIVLAVHRAARADHAP
jgi:hypothetical protein